MTDRQIDTGGSFLPGLSLVHGSDQLCFCGVALLTCHWLVHRTLLTDPPVSILRFALVYLRETRKSRCFWVPNEHLLLLHPSFT
jgi:hypothetical protein